MAVSTLDIQSIPNGAAPQAYTVPGSQSFVLVGVRAIFDGTAAGSAFLPCVQIKSAAGHVMQQVTGSSVLAGGSADVTFGSFLEQPAAGAATPPR